MLLLGASTVNIAAQEPPAPPETPPTSAHYELIAAHLCGDPEYLSCLEVSASQCRDQLREPRLAACAEAPYLAVESANDRAPSLVPPQLVECVYTGHIELRGLSPDAVNRCMGEAKLREENLEPRIWHDPWGDG